jgi:hypothetical protein
MKRGRIHHTKSLSLEHEVLIIGTLNNTEQRRRRRSRNRRRGRRKIMRKNKTHD